MFTGSITGQKPAFTGSEFPKESKGRSAIGFQAGIQETSQEFESRNIKWQYAKIALCAASFIALAIMLGGLALVALGIFLPSEVLGLTGIALWGAGGFGSILATSALMFMKISEE